MILESVGILISLGNTELIVFLMASNKFVMQSTSLEFFLPNLFNQIALIPTDEAPFTSLLKESPI